MTMQPLFKNLIFLLVKILFVMFPMQNILHYLPQCEQRMPRRIKAVQSNLFFSQSFPDLLSRSPSIWTSRTNISVKYDSHIPVCLTRLVFTHVFLK